MLPTSELPDGLENAQDALRAGDIAGWMAIYADDACHEFPFAPEGAPRELIGRDAIAAYMAHLPSIIRFGTLTNIRVRSTGDELIVEATGHHERVVDNSTKILSYVWFIERRDAKVTRIRDYMNPLQLAAIVSG
ncbi:nuclear transport factor 2 family protein [Gluconobacter kondonii]|uniref:nuclear transport factor 2 family protein n=1 Tax=Gluconobacter kondonii TaxID=941463 RepID=UPI00209DE191|nr:nuclear transport factor 2 family protein [Gluconobacter kondonii]MCP1237780.1 nuclear transport factor 2 family protein [Gluconobacter kondonii]